MTSFLCSWYSSKYLFANNRGKGAFQVLCFNHLVSLCISEFASCLHCIMTQNIKFQFNTEKLNPSYRQLTMSAVILHCLNFKISIFMLSFVFLMPGKNLTKTIPSFCFKLLHRPHCSYVSQTRNMRLTTYSKLPNWFPILPQKSLDRHLLSLALYTNDEIFRTANHYFILPSTVTANCTTNILTTYYWFPLYKRKWWRRKFLLNCSWEKVLLYGLNLWMKNISFMRHRDRFLDFTHTLDLGLCKILLLKRRWRRSLNSGVT